MCSLALSNYVGHFVFCKGTFSKIQKFLFGCSFLFPNPCLRLRLRPSFAAEPPYSHPTGHSTHQVQFRFLGLSRIVVPFAHWFLSKGVFLERQKKFWGKIVVGLYGVFIPRGWNPTPTFPRTSTFCVCRSWLMCQWVGSTQVRVRLEHTQRVSMPHESSSVCGALWHTDRRPKERRSLCCDYHCKIPVKVKKPHSNVVRSLCGSFDKSRSNQRTLVLNGRSPFRAKHREVVQYMSAGLKCPLAPAPYQTPSPPTRPPSPLPDPQLELGPPSWRCPPPPDSMTVGRQGRQGRIDQQGRIDDITDAARDFALQFPWAVLLVEFQSTDTGVNLVIINGTFVLIWF